VLELGGKLGPVLWQFAPFRKFDREDFGAFLGLLPREAGGRPLMHVVEVRHGSFRVPEFVGLLREHNVAAAYVDADGHPAIADVTADFVYGRLQRTEEEIDTGYSAADLDRWAERARSWESGGAPDDLLRIDNETSPQAKRPVFLYLISGAKVRAPAAAMALIERMKA
jgi:uncharacterized protein YecE (DUF72 family)